MPAAPIGLDEIHRTHAAISIVVSCTYRAVWFALNTRNGRSFATLAASMPKLQLHNTVINPLKSAANHKICSSPPCQHYPAVIIH